MLHMSHSGVAVAAAGAAAALATCAPLTTCSAASPAHLWLFRCGRMRTAGLAARTMATQRRMFCSAASRSSTAAGVSTYTGGGGAQGCQLSNAEQDTSGGAGVGWLYGQNDTALHMVLRI
jgi:hypothetical protein